MTEDTIVAVYDTPAHAELAIQDIILAGVPESAISQHSGTLSTSPTPAVESARETGFWASLFGGEPDHDPAVYDRSLENGSTVVTVKALETHSTRILEILDSHDPIDMVARAADYGLPPATTVRGSTEPEVPSDASATLATATHDETVQLAEERLAVGKRVVNRGGTRIRRVVVETPVEESISLHSERVMLDRRPVMDGRLVSDTNFMNKTIEMTESAEEAVVSKTARVVEEISLRRQATDHVETVRDSLRKDEVEIDQIPGEPTTTEAGVNVLSPRVSKT